MSNKIGRVSPSILSVLTVVVLLGGFPGCGDEEPEECGYPPLLTTPNGYRVHVPPLQVAIDNELLFAWLEKRIDNWVASHPEMEPDILYGVALSYPYILVDDYRFPAPESPTGFAGGRIHLAEGTDCPYIELAIYKRGTAVQPPPEAAPHTIRWNGESWSYGYIPEGGGMPAVAHELDHAIGIHHSFIDR